MLSAEHENVLKIENTRITCLWVLVGKVISNSRVINPQAGCDWDDETYNVLLLST